MEQKSILHIGFDDTDSPKAMCTTYLAYKIVNSIKNDVEFLDVPHLIRFNPNIPWKTRGNGAIALSIKTKNPKKITSRQCHNCTSPGPNCIPGLQTNREFI